MEFPDLGKYCENKHCKQIDFLPFTCDLCKHIYCQECRIYEVHECPQLHLKKDKIATLCPLCNEVVIVLPEDVPDEKVWAHIQAGCKDNSITNKCQVRKCKRIEVKPIICPYCQKRLCIDHRLPESHHCKKKPNKTNKSKPKDRKAGA